MADLQTLQFIGGAYDKIGWNPQTCVNLYPIPGGPGGKNSLLLKRVPGKTAWATIGTGAIRGQHVFGDYNYVVENTTLYQVTDAGVATAVGTLTTSGGRVEMADNGSKMLVVDGTKGYLWDGATLAAITDANMPLCSTCICKDGFFIVNEDDTDKFYVSVNAAEGSGPTVGTFVGASGLAFSLADERPDTLISIRGVGQHLLHFIGTRTHEIWYGTGAPIMPYSKQTSAEWGCLAAGTVATTPTDLLYLGQTNDGGVGVMMGGAGGFKQVATPPIQEKLEGYRAAAAVSDAVGYVYQQSGHTHYVLIFPSAEGGAGATWVYDLTMDIWHRRGIWNSSLSRYENTLGNNFVEFGGKRLVGGADNGKVYLLDDTAFTEGGSMLRAERTAMIVYANGKRIRFKSLTLDFLTGVGDLVTTDPQVMVDWSDDGGRTWSAVRQVSLGKIGEYSARVVLHRLGAARNRVFRVAVSDPVDVTLISASVDAKVLDS